MKKQLLTILLASASVQIMAMDWNGDEKLTLDEQLLEASVKNVHYSTIEHITKLIKEGANINAIMSEQQSWNYNNSYKGLTPLMIATKHGDLELVQLLIAHQANVNTLNTKNESALMTAFQCRCCRPELQLIQALIEAGANINTSESESTPLHEACVASSIEVIQYLLDHGANPSAKRSWDNRTPLYMGSDIDVHKLLVNTILEPIKKSKNTAILFLGMKKYNKAACMNMIDKNLILAIAHTLFDPAKIKELIDQINQILIDKLKQELLTYVHQELNITQDNQSK